MGGDASEGAVGESGAFILAGSVECCEWLDQHMPSPVEALLPAADELALEIGSVVQLFGRKFVAPGFRLLTNQHSAADQDLGRAFEAACTWWGSPPPPEEHWSRGFLLWPTLQHG